MSVHFHLLNIVLHFYYLWNKKSFAYQIPAVSVFMSLAYRLTVHPAKMWYRMFKNIVGKMVKSMKTHKSLKDIATHLFTAVITPSVAI
jgi:hypothetical protein